MTDQDKQLTTDTEACPQGVEPDSGQMTSDPAVVIAGDNGNGSPDHNRIVIRLLLALVSLAVLYTVVLAQEVMAPLALAFLLSLVLAPIVRWLEWLHVPRTLGACAWRNANYRLNTYT
jgi:hypothetical protein